MPAMSLLHSLKAVRQAPQVTTHEQRLQVLREQPPENVLAFLKERASTPDAGWIETLSSIGLLDLASAVKSRAPKHAPGSTVRQWCELVNVMLDFVGTPSLKTDLNGDGPEAARRFAVFRASDEVKLAFESATHRLVQTAGHWPTQGIDLPVLDSTASMSGHLIETVARWAGTACMLDQPESLKLLLDTWPSAMSCAIPVDSKTGKVAADHSSSEHSYFQQHVFGRFTPFYCALQVGSTACMDVIFDKRASLGLASDPSYAAAIKSPMTGGMSRPALLSHAVLYCVSMCSPASLAHAVKRCAADNPALANTFVGKLCVEGQKYPNHLAALVKAGLVLRTTDESKVRAIGVAMKHAPSALPGLLVDVPWGEMSRNLSSRSSIVMGCLDKIPKGKVGERERSVLDLIGQAKVDGHEDAVFPTFVEPPRGDATMGNIEPVSRLSALNLTSVLLQYMGHGFDPFECQVEARRAFALRETAANEKHPTEEFFDSYALRDQAMKLIDSMSSPIPNPSKAAG